MANACPQAPWLARSRGRLGLAQGRGFTLIELLVVAWVIAVLSTIAFPSYQTYIERSRVAEGLVLARPVLELVGEFRAHRGRWPDDNAALGLPEPAALSSQVVADISVAPDGVVLIRYRPSVVSPQSESEPLLSLQAVVNPRFPGGPLLWRCGESGVPDGLVALGVANTTLAQRLLPSSCR